MKRTTAGLAAAGWILAVAFGAWRYKASCPPQEAAGLPPVRVVAEVNGEQVYWDDVEFEVLARQAAMGVRYEGPAGEKQLEELRQAVVSALVDRLLLVQEARRRGHAASPEEVREERDKLLGQVPQRTELARRLAAGRYADQLDRFSTWAATGKKLLEDLKKRVQVTPGEVEAYYRRNRDTLFRLPPTVLADELNLPTREKAERARQLLLQGRSPEQVARDLGTQARRTALSQGITDPRRTQAVWDLPVGGVSEVVETAEGGYAVLKVAARQPEKVTPLEEARPRIEAILRSTEQRRLLADLLGELKAKAKVTVHWPPKQSPTPSPTP
jgi:parvulin-like peptidyl-prolyl isomerase